MANQFLVADTLLLSIFVWFIDRELGRYTNAEKLELIQNVWKPEDVEYGFSFVPPPTDICNAGADPWPIERSGTHYKVFDMGTDHPLIPWANSQRS